MTATPGGPTILLNITHGFQARMLLRSRISEVLQANGAHLVVCSPSSDEPAFRAEFEGGRATLVRTPERFSRVESKLINLRQYLLMNPSLGATLNHKNEAFRHQSPFWYHFARTGNAFLGRLPVLRRSYMRAEELVFRGDEFDRLLDASAPGLVVTGTPGFNPFDIHLLRAARRKGIPTATVMLSWDNLSSKGYMNGTPDHLLVWSEVMADEAAELHDFPRSRTRWTGAAQFDVYHGHRQRFDRAAWRRAHGVPGDAGLILYGTINPAILPHEFGIVEQLARAVAGGALRRPCHLWIRLHPQMVKGPFRTSIEPYRKLAGPFVHVEEPPVRDSALAWDLPKEDSLHLADLLCASDVMLTPCSTLVIDAACTDTPAVSVLHDGPAAVHPRLSVRRFAHYTHYSRLLRTGGAARAYSFEECLRQIEAYLENPQLHRKERQTIVAEQLGRLDGLSGERTAGALLEIASGARLRRGRIRPAGSGS